MPVKHRYKGSEPKLTDDEATQKIKEYLDYIKAEKRRPTIAGLAVFMGITKPTLITYSNKYKNFGLQYALMLCYTEDLLCQGKTAMDIFLLKSIYGYQDRVFIDTKNENTNKNSGDIKVSFTTVPDVDISKFVEITND